MSIINTKPKTLSALNTYLYVAPYNQGSSTESGRTIIVSATPTPTPTMHPAYSDIASAAWTSEAIETLTTLGVFNGYPDGTFKPNNPIIRDRPQSYLY